MKASTKVIVLMLVTFIVSSYAFFFNRMVLAEDESDWWNEDWEYRVALYVNQTGTEDLIDFPFLANGTAYIDTASVIAAGKMQADCDDIRILNNDSDDAVELNWHFENETSSTYGCNTDKTIIWVNSDNLSASNSTHWFYYGNEDVEETSLENETGVWESYVFRLGFGEEGGMSVFDSTANNYDFSLVDVPVWNCTDVFYGCSMTFDGSNDAIIGDDWGDSYTNYTIEISLDRRTDSGSYEVPIAKSSPECTDCYPIYLQILTDDTFQTAHRTGDPQVYLFSGLAVATGTPYYMGSVWNGSVFHAYLNDNDVSGITSGTPASPWNTADKWNIPRLFYGGSYIRYVNATIDEVRLSKIARSHDWIKRSYHQELSMTGKEENRRPCPDDDTYIDSDTQFSADLECNVSDQNSNGVLIINASNIVVDCNGMVLSGTGSGIGIYNSGYHNVSLNKCTVKDYEADIKVDNKLIGEVKEAASTYE
ncbi:MAG: DUF2341 domain-containing protein [Thermodesulfobacteriota bacterium]